MHGITGCEKLSDRALLTGARAIAGRERRELERLLRHLAEIDRRRLHEREGYPFCSYTASAR